MATEKLIRGRKAACWFIWLGLFHSFPVIWFLFVAGGLAPAVLLFAFGLAGLFNTDSGSLPMVAVTLGPALIYGGVFWGVAVLLSRLLWRFCQKPLLRTGSLLIFLAAQVWLAAQPIYVSGGHSSSYRHNFLQLLDSFKTSLPSWLLPTYLSVFVILLAGLLLYQHAPEWFPALPFDLQQRRRIKRYGAIFIVFIVVFGFVYSHRILLIARPLAELGLPAAQYRLGIAMHRQTMAEFTTSTKSKEWLERAAQQNHPEAAFELSRIATDNDERRRWLRVAATAGHVKAQYRLYQLLGKAKASAAERSEAGMWLSQAAEGEHPAALYELGRYAISGRNHLAIAKDQQQARSWLEQAAALGSGKAIQELAWRYRQGVEGWPLDLEQAAKYYQLLAEGYAEGRFGLKQNPQMATGTRQKVADIQTLQQQLAVDDPAALVEIGMQSLKSRDVSPEARQQALELLEKAANGGDADIQHQLGFILLRGQNQVPINLERGRFWWDLAAKQNHLKTMEYLVQAYQSGQYGYPVDLYRANLLTEKLIAAYRDGEYDAEPDAQKLRRWENEKKHFDRIAKLAGGYLSPDKLRADALLGNLDAQYQLAKQLLLSGHQSTRREGLDWLEKAAEGGLPEAQFRLVTYYETRKDILQNQPQRGVRLLTEAGAAGHLRALATLALAYEKGRYGLEQDFAQARDHYQQILTLHESGEFLGEVDERFIAFQRSRLRLAKKMLKSREK